MREQLLRLPWLYHLVQRLLAPGAEAAIRGKIKELLAQLPPGPRLLDVGCGPKSWLWLEGLDPVGLDIFAPYLSEFRKQGTLAVAASAAALPFRNHAFEGVWSIGLLHHLPDLLAGRALGEMRRVLRPGGYLVVLDAVLPENPWRFPLANLVRRLDRGRFMRREAELAALLRTGKRTQMERFTYSHTGLEALVAWEIC